MIKDFRGNEIKIGSKIVYVTYTNYSYSPSIYMNLGEVVGTFVKDFSDYRGKCDILQVKKENGKIVNVMALNRVAVLQEEIPLMIPSIFGIPEEFKVDPFELPQIPLTTGQFTFTSSQKTPFETIIDNLDQISKTERQELIRALIKGSINLRLEDLETEEEK